MLKLLAGGFEDFCVFGLFIFEVLVGGSCRAEVLVEYLRRLAGRWLASTGVRKSCY